MNHTNRRSLPRIAASALALCILIAAVANAPGSKTSVPGEMTVAVTPPVIVAATAPEPMKIGSDAFVAAPARFASAGQDAPDADLSVDEATTPIDPATDRRAASGELQQASGEESNTPDQDAPIRLAALDGLMGTRLAGGGRSAPRSHDTQSTNSNGASVPAHPDSDQGKHPADSAPIESMPSAPKDVPKDVDDAPANDAQDADDTRNETVAGQPAATDPLPNETVPGQTAANETDPPPNDAPIALTPIVPAVTQPVSVPEPGTLGLLALGLAGMAGARRRRATKRD